MQDFIEPKVSVILPFYNNPKETIRAIKSVKDQNYSNLEILIIDDGSDYRDKELDSIAFNDNNTLIIKNKKNMGPGYSRNIGIINSKGDYIAFLDSDDEWHPNKLKKQIYFMHTHNLEASHTSYERFDKRSQKVKSVFSGKYECKLPWSAFRCTVATPTVILKREIALASSFLEDIRFMEDTIYWLNIASKTNFTGLNINGCRVYVDDDTAAFNKKNLIDGMKIIRKNYFSSNLFLWITHFFYCKIRGI